jgi:hypothetical protein
MKVWQTRDWLWPEGYGCLSRNEPIVVHLCD